MSKNNSENKQNTVQKTAKANTDQKKAPTQKELDAKKNRTILIVCISIAAVIILSIILVVVWASKYADACEYLKTRDTSGRDIKYVEMSVEDYGKVVILLDATTAPETVANFISLVEDGFYDGLTFHRIIKDFMIQGGDPKGNGTGGNTDENGKEINIKGEFSSNGHENDISHKYGVISMARSNDPNSASSQFFICNADASRSLDGKYAAFGYVVEGLSVIDSITSGTLEKVQEYYGDNYVYWEYYGNGAIDSSFQPKIEYIKVLDSWKK